MSIAYASRIIYPFFYQNAIDMCLCNWHKGGEEKTVMEKITVYGLPLNPTPLLEQLAGASFCVSYATRDKLGKQLDQAIQLVGKDGLLLIDNGAFSHWQSGGAMTEEYIEGFEEWAQDILDRCPQAVAVIPDVIRGSVEENAALIETTMLDLDRCMPIWHMHEPISYLIGLCERFGYIGFGSTCDAPGSTKWHARIKEAFAAIDAWEKETGEPRPRIHMMRAQAFAHLYPFDSSDSTNVAVNHNRQLKVAGEDVQKFAARVNAKIQKSAGKAARHQELRPLLDHIETSNLKAVWFFEQAGYRVREPDLLDVTADQWLEQYHREAA
jgi:hypothetical protein